MAEPVQVVGSVKLVMLTNGKVECEFTGPGGRTQFNGMMLTAMQDMALLFQKNEAEAAAQGVAIPPPGFNGKAVDMSRFRGN